MNPAAGQPERFDRHYRIPSTGVWVGRALMAMYALCAATLILFVVSVGVILLTIFVVITAWMEWSFRRGGMYESDSGLRIVTGWGSRSVPWGSIASFRQASSSSRPRVLIVGTNGVASPIAGLSQGAHICWRDGETRDIVAVLNTRLGDWRSAHPAARPRVHPRH